MKKKSGKLIVLNYNGREINEKGEMISLTDMWKAQGSPKHQKPNDWIRLEETQKLFAFLESNYGLKPYLTLGGKYGGTYGNRQIAIAYARYLSTEFYAWMLTVVDDHAARLAGYRAIKTYLSRDPETQQARIEGKIIRRTLTDVIQDDYIPLAISQNPTTSYKDNPKLAFIRISKMLNKGLLEIDPDIKGENPRDFSDRRTILLLELTEGLMAEKIHEGKIQRKHYKYGVIPDVQAEIDRVEKAFGKQPIPPKMLEKFDPPVQIEG